MQKTSSFIISRSVASLSSETLKRMTRDPDYQDKEFRLTEILLFFKLVFRESESALGLGHSAPSNDDTLSTCCLIILFVLLLEPVNQKVL